MRPSFWEMVFDSDYKRRADINDALDAEHQLTSDVTVLHARVRQLTETVRGLSVTLATMVAMLGEQSLLDPEALRVRAEAMLADLLRPRPTAPSPAVASEIAPPRPPPLNTAPVRCIKCGRQVPANLTLITENGPIHDPACP